MTTIEKCPICEREVKVTEYKEDWLRLEEYYTCDMCGYGYEYCYGAYREFIEGVEYFDEVVNGVDISDVAFNKAKERWRNGSMTFKGMLTLIFSKSVKPYWYLEIPWHKRFKVWRQSYANPFMVIKMYIRSKRR